MEKIDNISLCKSLRLVDGYIDTAMVSRDGRSEPERIPAFISGQLPAYRNAIRDELRSVSADILLSIAAACVVCVAQLTNDTPITKKDQP